MDSAVAGEDGQPPDVPEKAENDTADKCERIHDFWADAGESSGADR